MKRIILTIIIAVSAIVAYTQEEEFTPQYIALSEAKSQIMFEWSEYSRLKRAGFVEQERKYYVSEKDGVRAPFRWFTFGEKKGDYYEVEVFVQDWSEKKSAMFISHTILENKQDENSQVIIAVLKRMMDEGVLYKQIFYTKHRDIFDYERALLIDNR